VKDILEFVGAAVLLYGGLYYGFLATRRLVDNLIRNEVLREEDISTEIHGERTSEENHGANAEISAPATYRPTSVLPVSAYGRLE
jgi:hypothetical protein